MNMTWVSADAITTNLEVSFNVNSNNYIHKINYWIVQALAKYKVYMPLEAAIVNLTLDANSTVFIPDDVKVISGISHNGAFVRQGRSYRGFNSYPLADYFDYVESVGYQIEVVKDEDGNVVSKTTNDIYIPKSVDEVNDNRFYFVNNSRVITFNFGEEGDVITLYYMRFPHDHDSFTGNYTVKVPDNEVIQENITWYILRCLLYTGYKHPMLNLGAAMPYLNPAKMYEDTFVGARNQFLKWDRADYGKVKNLFTTFLQAYHDPSINLVQH